MKFKLKRNDEVRRCLEVIHAYKDLRRSICYPPYLHIKYTTNNILMRIDHTEPTRGVFLYNPTKTRYGGIIFKNLKHMWDLSRSDDAKDKADIYVMNNIQFKLTEIYINQILKHGKNDQ